MHHQQGVRGGVATGDVHHKRSPPPCRRIAEEDLGVQQAVVHDHRLMSVTSHILACAGGCGCGCGCVQVGVSVSVGAGVCR